MLEKPALRFAAAPPSLTILAAVRSAAVNGIEAYPVEVEGNAGHGETLIVIVVNKSPKVFCLKTPAFIGFHICCCTNRFTA